MVGEGGVQALVENRFSVIGGSSAQYLAEAAVSDWRRAVFSD